MDKFHNYCDCILFLSELFNRLALWGFLPLKKESAVISKQSLIFLNNLIVSNNIIYI